MSRLNTPAPRGEGEREGETGGGGVNIVRRRTICNWVYCIDLCRCDVQAWASLFLLAVMLASFAMTATNCLVGASVQRLQIADKQQLVNCTAKFESPEAILAMEKLVELNMISNSTMLKEKKIKECEKNITRIFDVENNKAGIVREAATYYPGDLIAWACRVFKMALRDGHDEPVPTPEEAAEDETLLKNPPTCTADERDCCAEAIKAKEAKREEDKQHGRRAREPVYLAALRYLLKYAYPIAVAVFSMVFSKVTNSWSYAKKLMGFVKDLFLEHLICFCLKNREEKEAAKAEQPVTTTSTPVVVVPAVSTVAAAAAAMPPPSAPPMGQAYPSVPKSLAPPTASPSIFSSVKGTVSQAAHTAYQGMTLRFGVATPQGRARPQAINTRRPQSSLTPMSYQEDDATPNPKPPNTPSVQPESGADFDYHRAGY